MELIMKRKRRSIATCFTLLVSIFIFLNSALTPVRFSITFQELKRWKMKLEFSLSSLKPKPIGGIICDRSHRNYDLCSINGPALLDPRAYTLFGLDTNNSTPTTLKIRPYPRKTDKRAMSKVQELTLTSTPPKTRCGVTHHSPALVFSAGGYTGNFFHDFSDGLIPLFITINSLFSNQDIFLVIVDCRDWWGQKYAELLSHISDHSIINLSKENTIHCFPSTIIGLITHGPMMVDPISLPNPQTLLNFHKFLRNAYTKDNAQFNDHKKNVRPRMVLVSRNRDAGRAILNEKQVREAAEGVGFDVIIFGPTSNTSLSGSFKLIEESHAMLGVHGAGLTHLLFLRPGSVLLQVVPIATEWLSKTCFGNPGRALGLDYIEYKIGAEESSLVEMFGNTSLVIKEPKAFVKGNWTNMGLYLKAQNVKLDLVRFRGYLRVAHEKAKKFMDIEG